METSSFLVPLAVITLIVLSLVGLLRGLLWVVRTLRDFETIEGRVVRRHPIGRYSVQILLKDLPAVIELYTDSPWVVYPGDQVTLVGQTDRDGKLIARAYRNTTQGVSGHATLNLNAWFTLAIGVGVLSTIGMDHWIPFAVGLVFSFNGVVGIFEDIRTRRCIGLLDNA